MVSEVWHVAVVQSVPAAGNVHVPVAGIAKVGLKAPVKATLPARVKVKAPLLTPVPPCVPVSGFASVVPQDVPAFMVTNPVEVG